MEGDRRGRIRDARVVDWFDRRRLLEPIAPIAHVPPAEFTAADCRREDSTEDVRLNQPSLRVNPGRSNILAASAGSESGR